MKAKIGISEEHLLLVSEHLNKILADTYVLYTKTKKAHWNFEGNDFYSKHKLFEEQYEAIDEIIDNIAERIRSLGHYVPASLKDFLALTHLTEASRASNTGSDFCKELLEDHEIMILKLREYIPAFANDYKDAGTSDFITGIMEQHEKMAWILRATIN